MEKLNQFLFNIEQEIRWLEREIERQNYTGISCLVNMKLLDSYRRLLK